MTAITEDRFYDRALERIARLMVALGGGGTVAAWAWRGWTWGGGFAVGAAASWLNYRWLKNIVNTLAGRRPKSKSVAILAGLRYLLLGGGAYVILKYSKISVAAALAGLFVSAAAVIIEILIELLYARE
jgi:small-conductance mechanosensitive channel